MRESFAMQLLKQLNLKGYCLPCSSIFASDFHRIFPEEPKFVAVNYMRGEAHYDLGQKLDYDNWETNFIKIYNNLRLKHRIIVMCHSASEVIYVRYMIPDADTFFSVRYEDYLKMYAKAKFGVFNRVHAAMALAGFSRPSVVIGNDTRAKMAELMNLPTFFVNDVNLEQLNNILDAFELEPGRWYEKLIGLKEYTRQKYLHHISQSIFNIINTLSEKDGYKRSDFDSVKNNNY